MKVLCKPKKRKGVEMGTHKFLSDDHRLANHLSGLLHNVLKFHEVDGLAEIVLHELCHDNCFGIKKATYLIDNPDFNQLVGAAGFCKQECCQHKHDLWDGPHTFKKDMEKAEFHNVVKTLMKDSFKRQNIDLNNSETILDLGRGLGMEKPRFFSWTMKHGNHGLLIFEQGDKQICDWRAGMLTNASALLSFCGI